MNLEREPLRLLALTEALYGRLDQPMPAVEEWRRRYGRRR